MTSTATSRGTSNPKVAFNWAPIEDLTIRGTWGNSFRAPVFGEISPLANVAIAGRNLGAPRRQRPTRIDRRLHAGANLPPEGSGAWKVLSSSGDGTPGSATVCPAPTSSAAQRSRLADPLQPARHHFLGGSAGAEPIRAGGLKGWTGLTPELATNWGIGFDYTPTANFLTGLNIQATYYIIKINNVLTGFGNPNSELLQRSATSAISPSSCPPIGSIRGSPGAAGCTSNLLPTTCAPFQDAVTGSASPIPEPQIDPQAKTLIMWINDGGLFNKGWLKLDGIDCQASYDWDWGDLGAFNVGIIGTYYLHNKTQAVPGAPTSSTIYPPRRQLGPGERSAGRGDAVRACATARVWAGPMGRGRHRVHGLRGRTTTTRRARRPM